MTLTADELSVTPSAVSHRVRQLEEVLGTQLFGRSDFSLTTEGTNYLQQVREGLGALQRFPNLPLSSGRKRLKIAVTPTFARCLLIPKLSQFMVAYPEIDIALQVAIPLLDVVAEDADLIVRYGTGHYADVEYMEIARDVYTPLASPAFLRQHGPIDAPEDLSELPLLRSPLEPWQPWFRAAGLDWAEPAEGSQFNDVGLLCDAAAGGLGIAPVRLKLGAPWLDNGTFGAFVRFGCAQRQCPLPVLAHRHHGPLGVQCVCRVVGQGGELNASLKRELVALEFIDF